MRQVVELDAGEAGSRQRLAPPVADSVLVRWVLALSGEEPLFLPGGAVSCDALGGHVDEAVGEIHDALGAVLRGAHVDRAGVDALDLARHLERLAEEVDVAELHAGSLAESQAGEGAEGDEWLEPFVGHGHELPHVFGCGDRHGDVGATAAGEAYCVGRVGSDHPILDGGAKHRPDVDVPGLDRAGGEAGGVHLLDPGLDVRSPDFLHRLPREGHRSGRQRHREHGAGCPDLAGRPLPEERGERDPAGLGVGVRAGDHRRGDLVQPLLGVDLAVEVSRVLLPGLVAIPRPPLAVGSLGDVASHGDAPSRIAPSSL